MKRIILFILLITGIAFAQHVAKAQDTASTSGIQFTPINTPPATKTTGTTKKDGSREKTADKKRGKAALKETAKGQSKQAPWAIFLAGLAGGFAALLMPCIFPMLPLTVSYFTKSGDNKGSAVGKAAIYGASIVAIYVVMGLLVTIIFGPDALNSLSTNGIFNFGFFLLIVAFAASFLGAFEITLPSGWVNKMDQNSDKGGLAGLFFMAATLALVSFSCTGPIIGTLLVQAATTGALLGPAIGMLGFALALAIPFVLFAMFPSWLQSLPKSGGWLNSVKVTLGFLELALSFKFLSNVDLAYHWHWFDREIFLVLWIVIFALMGFYLLGKLKFSHDSDLKYISVPRLFLAIIVLAFSMYMVPGLWGAPLKSISAFLPPQATQDFDLSNPGMNTDNRNSNTITDVRPHKYADLFDKPKGFNPYFDYDEGLAYAKKVHKPVMIDFTGHACVNCRKMEADVWPDKQVYQRITQDYVLIQLYVDDKTDLAKAEQTTTPEGRKIQTIGNKWSYLQTSKFGSNSQPFYVLLDPDTQAPLVTPQGADYDPLSYLKYLDSGLKGYVKQ
ncbi:thiol:disulfide interchange protein DsbD [Mucilaginibacter oryzae]|uniref:Thiol:disulfide interchange protein DsbD n=1 Tax=Mucilaginibacter oryzae TaxID=468058 RepID=A0A316HMX9_9SPHI|nr:cytochrome c biogenesis protein CcdA [Mucilaginibacter oryzae]PWK79565.1 thiol:disulfide interchange protein DsbD [Mucilaginibacter oryzae]